MGAVRWSLFSSSLSGYTFGTGVGFPSLSTATIVKNDSVVNFSLLFAKSWAVTFTYTSIELVHVYVTKASSFKASPTFAADKKLTESIDAVTTTHWASFMAA